MYQWNKIFSKTFDTQSTKVWCTLQAPSYSRARSWAAHPMDAARLNAAHVSAGTQRVSAHTVTGNVYYFLFSDRFYTKSAASWKLAIILSADQNKAQDTCTACIKACKRLRMAWVQYLAHLYGYLRKCRPKILKFVVVSKYFNFGIYRYTLTSLKYPCLVQIINGIILAGW